MLLKKSILFFIFFLLFKTIVLSQNPDCPSPYVYMDGGAFIKVYNPSQPLSINNPSNTNIPTFGSGLALMPNINGGTLCPTFYSVSGGNYWYWSGLSWVNTGHSTGNAAAVNIAGCGSSIYNLVGGTGQIYVYNGTSNGTLLTTIPGFNGGGPYDLVTDCNCNFYALNTTVPNQTLSMYNPAGALVNTYTLIGMPNASAGGGFAIIGNMIYVKNNIGAPGGFYIGTIVGNLITFTTVPGFLPSPGDFASCPLCTNATPQPTINASISIGGQLSCIITTLNLSVTTTLNPVNYFWSGPGIVGSNSGSLIIVNSAGVYSCVVSGIGCPSSQLTLTSSISSNTTPVIAVMTPSGNICTNATGSLQLQVSPSVSTTIISWTGPGIIGNNSNSSILTNSAGIYNVIVTNSINGCSASNSVMISQTPTVIITLSSNSICARPINGSPAILSLTASGAANYTLLTNSNYSSSVQNGSLITITPIAPFSPTVISPTIFLLGSTGICSNFDSKTFSILPNPTILISPSPASICVGGAKSFSVFGANTYSWSGSPGLNTLSGPLVISTATTTSIYSVTGSSVGCKSATESTTLTVYIIPTVTVSPVSSTICLGSSVAISATGSGINYSWLPNQGLTNAIGANVISTPTSTTIYTVTAELNTCTITGISVVNVVNPPIISLALSSNTVCEYNYNGSPNVINATPSGATSYSFIGGQNYSIGFANGSVYPFTPIGFQQLTNSVASVTLIGYLSVCTVSITKTFTIIPNPNLSISPSFTAICPSKNQVFYVFGATTYSWLPSQDLNTFSGNIVLATPINSNIYSVVGTSLGCNSAVKSSTLTVLPLPNVLVTPSSPTLCIGNSVNLYVYGNATNYIWTPTVGLSSSTGTNIVSTPLSTQNYSIIGSLNTCTNMAIASVSAIIVPVVNVTASQLTVCSGANTYLNATGAGGFIWSPYQYLNYPNGGNVIANPTSNTTFTVFGYNGICSGSTTILISTLPMPTIRFLTSENQICFGKKLVIMTEGAQSFSWSPQLGLSNNTGSIVTVSPPVTTNYTIIGVNSNGTLTCNQQLSYSVIVVPTTTALVSNSVTLCEGEKTTLTGFGGNNYTWQPNIGLNISNANKVVANPSITTIYSVNVTQSGFCGSTATVLVVVNPMPQVDAGRDTVYNLDEPIFISANGTGSLTWISGEGIDCKICPVTRITTNQYECYVVEAKNEFNCKVQDKVCIEVTSEFGIYIPNTFTPNNDKKNDVFYIFSTSISNFSMQIFDRWGSIVFFTNDQSFGWDGTYNGNECKNDIYIYKIEYKGLNGKKYLKNGFINLLR